MDDNQAHNGRDASDINHRLDPPAVDHVFGEFDYTDWLDPLDSIDDVSGAVDSALYSIEDAILRRLTEDYGEERCW
jgi:hypothetical protein